MPPPPIRIPPIFAPIAVVDTPSGPAEVYPAPVEFVTLQCSVPNPFYRPQAKLKPLAEGSSESAEG